MSRPRKYVRADGSYDPRQAKRFSNRLGARKRRSPTNHGDNFVDKRKNPKLTLEGLTQAAFEDLQRAGVEEREALRIAHEIAAFDRKVVRSDNLYRTIKQYSLTYSPHA
jgi:hypothetical protein